jgi:hypothetical protein
MACIQDEETKEIMIYPCVAEDARYKSILDGIRILVYYSTILTLFLVTYIKGVIIMLFLELG